MQRICFYSKTLMIRDESFRMSFFEESYVLEMKVSHGRSTLLRNSGNTLPPDTTRLQRIE
jgi:hypothetical protein